MYNIVYSYFQDNNLLYNKQFGFRNSHSTEHAILELTDEVINSFSNDSYVLGIFIDLSKAFDTVNHEILLEKLKSYGMIGLGLKWLKRYLCNREQFIKVDDYQTDYASITCGVPQGSILGPLLFLIYVNDLNKLTNLLNIIMFADDTSLFCSHKDVKILFKTENKELIKITKWFQGNKLSLNMKKTNYIFFHKKNKQYDIPLKLPNLSINNNFIS